MPRTAPRSHGPLSRPLQRPRPPARCRQTPDSPACPRFASDLSSVCPDYPLVGWRRGHPGSAPTTPVVSRDPEANRTARAQAPTGPPGRLREGSPMPPTPRCARSGRPRRPTAARDRGRWRASADPVARTPSPRARRAARSTASGCDGANRPAGTRESRTARCRNPTVAPRRLPPARGPDAGQRATSTWAAPARPPSPDTTADRGRNREGHWSRSSNRWPRRVLASAREVPLTGSSRESARRLWRT